MLAGEAHAGYRGPRRELLLEDRRRVLVRVAVMVLVLVRVARSDAGVASRGTGGRARGAAGETAWARADDAGGLRIGAAVAVVGFQRSRGVAWRFCEEII